MHCTHSSFNGRVGAFRQQQPRPQNLRSVTPVTECKESRIGKAPVPIPTGVTVTIKGSHLTVKVKTAATEHVNSADTVQWSVCSTVSAVASAPILGQTSLLHSITPRQVSATSERACIGPQGTA